MTNDSGSTATSARSAAPEPPDGGGGEPAAVGRATRRPAGSGQPRRGTAPRTRTTPAADATTAPGPHDAAEPAAHEAAAPDAATPNAEADAALDTAAEPAGHEAPAPTPEATAEPEPAEPEPAGSEPATPEPARSEPATREPAAEPSPVRTPAISVLAVLAVVWLVAMLGSARAAISAGDGGLAITAAAYSLPGVLSAVLVCGAALGLVAVTLVARRWSPAHGDRPGVRSAVALGAGLVTGLAGAVTVIVAYGTGSASMVMAGTVAAAGTIGGAIAGLRARHLVAGAIAATLAVFAVGFLLNLFKGPLLALYGLGASEASQLSAYGWFAATASVASGLAAGLVAYRYLRLAARGAAVPPRWPTYLAAGAGPGVLLLVAELITRLGGARVLSLAGAVSDNDRTVQVWLDGSRTNKAIVVLFAGAITAMIAFGRTLRPTEPDDGDDAGAAEGRSVDE